MQRLLACVLCVVAAALLLPSGGCQSTRAGSGPAASLPERPREAVAVYYREGNRAAWEAMVEAVRGADVIVIGETHGHPLGLEAAACLWDDLLARDPEAALLLEFFERDQQVAIDDYLTGVTDEEGFRKAAGRSGGNYPAGHRRMVEAAKAAGRPVIAANAPRRYVRKAQPDGYGELVRLGEEQRRLYALPDAAPEGRYREEFFELMSGSDHGPGGEGGQMPAEMVEKMYRSQVMWDATMADTVVRAALRGYRPVVLVVGRFHADFGGGTVQMIERARPDLDVRTLSMVAADGSSLDEDDRGRADFVVYVGPGPDEGS
jgi:uncharacterized iron-regulated protein